MGSALFAAAHAAPLFDVRLGSVSVALDMPEPAVRKPRLSKVVSLSGNAPAPAVKRLLIPGLSDGRWRHAFSFSGLFGYCAYRTLNARMSMSEVEAFTLLTGQGGGSILAAYRAPAGDFGLAMRVHANGVVRIAFDYPARPEVRAGSGLLPVNGIAYNPTPVPLPPAAFLMLGALLPLGLAARRRQRRGRRD
ncbi:hypothetical protein OU426_13485 [Frigidibacter sp. RF13]|uniref:hypothetical protein n=1 Tax=Frigidibacter sp. RF13 TaxID=2997340 RepID=UPI00227148DB|nr:hypothetical protein [Frigidibacter sp. RF13]MCY1127871.1 hypothetical protein [Frigidibacter sp. RF13]